ncbi:MAG: LicD family protein [Ruminococcaceae bacterium]|nr:LicD family protein [Oscillospiraceae bacterium]
MTYTLAELQQIELQILTDFADFCKENALRYYLIGGALLGAVRYQKFIPWDDDVDVAMPREDYERLKTVFSSEKYFLQNAQSDPLFSRCIQKVRLNGTEIAEEGCLGINIHQGIYIDIFPIDYVANNNQKVLSRKAKEIRCLMSLRAIKGGYVNGRYAAAKKFIRVLCPLTLQFIDRKIDRLCTQENAGERKYAILWLHNYSWNKQFHEASVFGNGSVCSFEGHEFTAPADTDAFLRRVFGEDYMQEPAMEKRKCPHNYINVCANITKGEELS